MEYKIKEKQFKDRTKNILNNNLREDVEGGIEDYVADFYER